MYTICFLFHIFPRSLNTGSVDRDRERARILPCDNKRDWYRKRDSTVNPFRAG